MIRAMWAVASVISALFSVAASSAFFLGFGGGWLILSGLGLAIAYVALLRHDTADLNDRTPRSASPIESGN